MIKGLVLSNGDNVVLNKNQFFQESKSKKSIELWDNSNKELPHFIKRFNQRQILFIQEA